MTRRLRRPPKFDPLGPTPERRAMDGFIQVPTDKPGVLAYQAVTQDALDRYWRRGDLAPKQPAENARRYEAGRRLREAWERSGLASLGCGGLEPAVDSGRDPERRIVGAIDAGAEFRRLYALVGPGCQADVFRCCCDGNPVGRRWPMDRLRLGLATLATGLKI